MSTDKSIGQANLEYPCPWGYNLIAGEESHIHLAIRQTFGHHPVKLGEIRKSTGGRWCALNVDTTVMDESQRQNFLEKLRSCAGIRYVL